MNKIIFALTKKLDPNTNHQHRERYITVWQLSMITVGCIMGSGVYMASGIMINRQAGPASMISFLFAGLMIILLGLMYAEIGTRVPLSGSFYAFGSAVYGEMMGFVIGIQFAISYLFAAVTVSKSLSYYIDSLCNNSISNYFYTVKLPDSPYLSEFLDPMPLFLNILLSVLFLFKSKNSNSIAILLILINLIVLSTVIIGGSQFIDTNNWNLSPSNISGKGNGGFMPYGISGIFVASLGGFFSLLGVDIISMIAGDVINPNKAIPISTIVTVIVATIAYVATTAVISLMLPYYDIDVKAPYSVAFQSKGNQALSYIVSVGCICGLFSNLYGTIFAGSHLIYSMSLNGIYRKYLYHENGDIMIRRISLVMCLVIGILSMFTTADITLGISEISVLIPSVMLEIMVINIRYSAKPILINEDSRFKRDLTNREVKTARLMTAISFFSSLVIAILIRNPISGKIIYYSILGLLILLVVFSTSMMFKLPQMKNTKIYMTPLVPFLPILTNFFMFILLVYVDKETWIIHLSILAILCLFYFISIAFFAMRDNL